MNSPFSGPAACFQGLCQFQGEYLNWNAFNKKDAKGNSVFGQPVNPSRKHQTQQLQKSSMKLTNFMLRGCLVTSTLLTLLTWNLLLLFARWIKTGNNKKIEKIVAQFETSNKKSAFLSFNNKNWRKLRLGPKLNFNGASPRLVTRPSCFFRPWES